MKNNTPEYSDQSFRQLFAKLPEEELPPHFQQKVMEGILRQEKTQNLRKLWIIWSSVSLSCIAIIAMVALLFSYLSIDLGGYFKEIFTLPEIHLESWTPYIFIGGIALVLLITDSYLRKLFYKKHSLID